MGLDIIAISQARFVHSGRSCEVRDHFHIWSQPQLIDRLDGYQIGCYVSESIWMGFGTGDYSTYSKFRSLLSYVALGVKPRVVWDEFSDFKGKPFVELIKMSDYDGAIGPLTSKKLAEDFSSLQDSIEQKLRETIEKRDLQDFFEEQDISWWLSRYAKWLEAFTIASDSGFVIFH